MWITQSISCLVLFSACFGDTILYTNSPRHLVTSENYTSYKLAVPGADPITIIEATQGPPREDGESSSGSLNEMRKQNWISDESFLFRRKDHGRFGNDHKEESHDQSKPRTTVYSPDLLKKFMDDYANKVKNSSPETKQKLQEILLFDDDNEDVNFPLNSQPEEKYGHNQHDWNQDQNQFDDRRYERPPNSGWVTMDVVPWSSSKVSKWQGHVQRLPHRPDTSRPIDYGSTDDFDDRYQQQSQNNYNRPSPSRPSYNDFDEVDRFSSSVHHHNNHQHNTPHYSSHNSNKYPDSKPSYYDYQTSSSSQSNNHYNSPPPDKHQDIYRPWHGDIITDNRAPDFPDQHSSHGSYPNKNRRPGESSYDNYNNGEYNHRPHNTHKSTRPTQSPESGNGDWILVSTTKGYHRPRNGQRAVAVKPQPISNHKTVRFSVAVDKKPQQSTFSFDSEAHNDDQDQSGEHSMTTSHRPVKKLSTVHDQQSQKKQQKKVAKKVMSVGGGVDSSAVLAAVGAGMVPATVAMLMPMIAGRRKKRDLSATPMTLRQGRTRNVTHFPDLDYEETLQRILLQKHVR